jgi:hypothetical protein
MATTNSGPSPFESLKTWISPFAVIIGVISMIAVGHYQINANCVVIDRNTEHIDSLRMFQAEVKTEVRHIHTLLQQIDKKLDK